MKKVAYGFGGLVALLIAAALIVPSLIDWNAYKSDITAEAQKATGRTLEIAGDLQLGVLPTPHLSVRDARFANAPGATAKHMATLKELRASVKLLPLLTGTVEIARIELIEPVIELEMMAGGKGNWVFTPPGKPETSSSAGAKPATASASDESGSDAQALSLDLLRIQNGTLIYRDKTAGTVERIVNLNTDMSAGSLTGPFTAKGGLQLRDIGLTIDARIGRFAAKGAVPFDVVLGTPKTNARIGLKGTVTDIETKPTVSAKLDGKADNLGALVAALSGSAAPPQLAKPFSLTATVTGSPESIRTGELAVGLGTSRVTGVIAATLKDQIRATVSLRAKKLNADEWLAADNGSAAPVASSASASVSENGPSGPTASKPAATNANSGGLPADILANLDIEIGEIIVKQGRVRNVRLDAALKNGTVTMKTLAATLPGGAAFKASGTLASPNGTMAYTGKTSFRTANLRTLLNWLEIDVASVPADRLRRFSLAADLSGNPGQIQIANITGQLDASRMNGGVTVALRDRPAFGASVNIDQFNADAYMGKPAVASPANQAAPDTSPRTKTAKSNGSKSGPLAALNGFDANLAFRIGSLNYQKTTIQGVRLDGTLVDGALTLRDASVRNLAGTSLQVKGTLTGLSGVPAFKGTIAAASNDLTGLFRVAGVDPPVPPRKLGRMRLTSRTDATADKLTIDASLRIAEVRAKVTGNVSGLSGEPAFDLKLDGQHPELARLANLFSTGKPGPKAGQVSLSANLRGSAKAVKIAANARLAGGTFRISGDVDTPSETPRINLGFNLKHPDLVRFVRAFDPGFRPAKRQLGSVNLAAKLQGTDRDMTIRDLAGNIGPTRIKGQGTYIDKSPRPDLKLVLSSSVIPLSDFLSAPGRRPAQSSRRQSGSGSQSGGRPATAPAGQRWSTERIDTSALGMVDANIDISADALLYQNYRVDRPKILAVLKDKILDVQQISGKMFDGSFEMQAKLDGRKTPAAQANIKIANANVRDAFFAGKEYDIEAGRLSNDLSVATRGRSQLEMIRALNGAGTLTVTDGIIKGFDLNSVSRSLSGDSFSNLAGILQVLQGAFNKEGRTKFSSLKTNLKITNGVVAKDTVFVSDAADGRAVGKIDLPNWQMNIPAEIVLKQLKDRPAFQVTVLGAPDNPDYRFNVEKIAANLIQKGLGSVLKKFLPSDKSGSGSTGSQQKAPAVENLIKDIFKLGR